MSIFLPIAAFFLSVSLFISSSAQINAQQNNPKKRLIIKYAPQAGILDKVKIKNSVNALASENIEKLNSEVIEVPEGFLGKALEILLKQDKVLYAEEDNVAQAFETSNDPYIGSQWGLVKIEASGVNESAWNYSKGSQDVLVAVVDTGIDQNHTDLSGKIAKNKNCTSNMSVDDNYGHGTHVAGIVAAATNNSIGVAGTGYNIRLINAKGLGDNGSGYYSWIANCIIWSADNGASVINLSLGGSSSSQTLMDAVNYAVNKGTVVVAAAGNSNTSSPSYPAYYANVVAVAATDANDTRASFSNYGSWVDLAAPGVSIYSTAPNHSNSLKINNYAYLSGTSMASPFVAGLAALLKSSGNLSNQQIVDNLYANADKIQQTGNYWIHGRINALKSVKEISAFAPTSAPTITQVLTPTPTQSIVISPTPTPTRTPTPTNTPSKTPTPSPVQSGTTPTPIPWWCRFFRC